MSTQPEVVYRNTEYDYAATMAQLVNTELGTSLTPEEIMRLFRKRFATLSHLAHGMHKHIEARLDENLRAQQDRFGFDRQAIVDQ